MKNYLLYSFLERGISISDIEIIDYYTNSAFDLIIDNKKEQFIEKHGNRSSSILMMDIIQDSREWLFHNYITHNYMLIGVGASYARLNYLNSGRVAKNIFEWPKYVEMRKRNQNLVKVEYENYSESLDKLMDWITDQYTLVFSEIILMLILQHKKCIYSKFKSLLESYIENKNIPVTVNNDEFNNLIDSLIQNNYLIYKNDTLYFPDNIFYKSEAPVSDLVNSNKTDVFVPTDFNNEFSTREKVHVVTREKFRNKNISDVPKVNKLVVQKTEVVETYSKSLKDIVYEKSLSAKILHNILEGKSLIKICSELNIKISEVLDIEKNILSNLDKIYEVNKYRSRFEEYKFTSEFFYKYFSEPEYVFNFLTLTLKKGKKSLVQYLTSTDDFSEYEKNKILIKEFGGFINRFDEYVEPTFENIFDEVLYKYKNRYFQVVEFQHFYDNLKIIQSKDVKTPASKFLSYSEKSRYSISTSGGLFRYFDTYLDERVFNELYNAIFFLKDGLYNTKKLFDKENKLMSNLGIRDEFELQSLLRKIIHKLPKNLSILRRNLFIKGDINKIDFYKRELLNSVGETVDDLSNMLQIQYGLNKLSSSAYINKEFKEFIRNGLIIGERGENSIIYNISSLKNNLNETFYLLQDIMNIFEEENVEFNLEILCEIGYSLEKGIVYKSVYENCYQAVLSYLKTQQKISINNSKIFKDKEIKNIINRAEREREIIALNENFYLTRGLLNKRGISIKDLQKFIDSVLEFVENYEYFTILQIREDGFKNRLLIFDFDLYCYERLLSTSNYFMTVTNSGSEIYAIRNKSDSKLASFIDYELEQYDFVKDSMDIYDFVNKLNEKYHTSLSEDYVISILQRSKYFYAPLLKKVFETKEDYYDYIY